MISLTVSPSTGIPASNNNKRKLFNINHFNCRIYLTDGRELKNENRVYKDGLVNIIKKVRST